MVRTTGTPQRAAARLPQRPPTSAGDRLKGFASLLAILAIVGGVPYVLLTFFGTPWPDQMPNRDVLFGELTAESVLGIIAFFIWVAWAHFLICLVAEAIAERKGHGLSPRVPLGGGSQTLARRLISGVVLLVGAASVTLPVANAATLSTVGPQNSITATAGGDSRSSYLETEAPSKVDLGGGVKTGVRTNNDQSGKVIKYTEVRPPEGRNYDCLWDIAERHLGDGRRYKEIYDLNKNKLQPDGRRLTNPDLIMPGWQVRLPADAKGAGVHTVKVNVEDKIGDKTTDKKVVETKDEKKTGEHRQKPGKSVTDKRTGQGGGNGEVIEVEKPSSVEIGDASKDPKAKDSKPGTVKPDKVAPHVPGSDGNTGGPVAGGSRVYDAPAPVATESGFDPVEAGLYGFGATLLAAGLALALKRRRGWAIGPGPKSGSHRQTEVDLRLASDVPTAQFVDGALRHLGAALKQQNQPVPAIVAALVTDKALTLVLAPTENPAAPPAPWGVIADGRRWVLRRAYAPEAEITAPAPYPSLVTVGRNADHAIVLVDLSQAHGIASFGGVVNAARDVVGSLAVELATNLWSEGARVSMVGFGDDLSALAPSRLRYRSSLYEALGDVLRRTDAQAEACGRYGVESVTRARIIHPDEDLWGAEILVLSAPPSPEEAYQLNQLAADPRRSVGVLVVGDVMTAPLRFVVDEKDNLVCRLLGLEVDAHRIAPEQFADLVALFNAAEADARDKVRQEQDMPAYEYAGSDLSQAAPVEIDLLGPVEVDARGELEDGRLELATEIAAFLASQDYGVHPNVLVGSIWPRGISDELRDAALEHTRRWLGPDAMYADESGRWMLNRTVVRVDWDIFRTLTKQASLMDDPRGPLSTALGLVHGPAWSKLPAGRYSWLATSGIERRMAEAVVDAALKLAEASLRANDGNLARTALQTGLKFDPASEELWRATLRLADHFGQREDVSTVAAQMYSALAKHGGPRGAEPETDALVDELLPGFRRPHAVVA